LLSFIYAESCYCGDCSILNSYQFPINEADELGYKKMVRYFKPFFEAHRKCQPRNCSCDPLQPAENFIFFNIQITVETFSRILEGEYLDDNSLNVFGAFLENRSLFELSVFPKLFCYSTFFWLFMPVKLNDRIYYNFGKKQKEFKADDRAKLIRWIKKSFKMELEEVAGNPLNGVELLFFPLNNGVHWALGAIDLINKRILYGDSLGCLMLKEFDARVRCYMEFVCEIFPATKDTFCRSSEWKTVNINVPTQPDGVSCGAAVCLAMESLSRRSKTTFSQVVYRLYNPSNFKYMYN
jgi:Ulp1 family protease